MTRKLFSSDDHRRGTRGVGVRRVSLAAYPPALALALLLSTGHCSTAAASSATGPAAGNTAPTAGFISLPAPRSGTAQAPSAETLPRTIKTAAATTAATAVSAALHFSGIRPASAGTGGRRSGGRSLFSSAVAESESGGAAAVQEGEQDRRRRATKSALLGVFGEKIDGADADGAKSDPILACPATLGDLTDAVRSYGGVGPAALLVSYKASEKMPGTKYRVESDFVDFAEPLKPAWKLSRGETVKEGTFQGPVTPFLYERGWRQSFNSNGFPGIDEEFRQVTEYFSGTGADGGAVIDLSCGSGLMMRRLVSSGRYSRVIGGDLSPTMLAETARRFRQEDLGVPELIRCDVSKLPLKTASLDGVHAGAALHCWSKLDESLTEVYRVLKPGKGFFATTFLTTSSLGGAPTGRTTDGFKFFEVDELDRIMRDAGFADVKVMKEGRGCAIIRATKGDDEL
eukprot:g18525.t1